MNPFFRMPKLTERQLRVLELVCERSPLDSPRSSGLTVREVSRRLSIPKSNVHRDLLALREAMCIERYVPFQTSIEATPRGHHVRSIASGAPWRFARDAGGTGA